MRLATLLEEIVDDVFYELGSIELLGVKSHCGPVCAKTAGDLETQFFQNGKGGGKRGGHICRS